jgi:hypothetical protein
MSKQRQPSNPEDQEQLVERRPYHEDPTRVENTRGSDASTVSNGGLAGGRAEGGATITPERARYEEGVRQSPEVQGGDDAPRSERAAQDEDDPVMPADESTLNIKV